MGGATSSLPELDRVPLRPECFICVTGLTRLTGQLKGKNSELKRGI